MASSESPAQTVRNLNLARTIVLNDPSHYPQVLPTILGLLSPSAQLEIRRWGTEFIAEMFASPVLDQDKKLALSITSLDPLKAYLDIPGEDTAVVKSVVQAAASIYPLVFRYIINNPTDKATWDKMAAIRSNILQRMDTAPPGVRICCIKFIQRVVQTQTSGASPDPRRPEQNDISLSLVPRDHPLIPPSLLEAQASGLLDRLLGILQENLSDALLVTATLNSLGSLVRTRPAISNKIINTVLNFNPLKLANAPMTPKSRVVIKSMERTTKAFLLHILKRNNTHPLAGRMQQYLERLQQSRHEIFDEANRKRPAPVEPTDGLDSVKRQRLGAQAPGMSLQRPVVPPLPPGPVSFAQLFTLTEDPGSKNFDVQAIPLDLVVRILVPMIHSIDEKVMKNAVNAVKGRLSKLEERPPPSAGDAALAVTGKPPPTDEEDEYEPDYPTEAADQTISKLNAEATEDRPPPQMVLGPFKFPPPPPLSPPELAEYSKGTVERIFHFLGTLDEAPATAKRQKAGFNRLAASSYDRDAWITVLARLATRASAGLDEREGFVKGEFDAVAKTNGTTFSIANTIREALNLYIVQDFRRRIDVAVAWLNEEWYNDRINASPPLKDGDMGATYKSWVTKLLDELLPFLEAKDQKVLIRFLSEVPALDREMIEKVKRLARDPERVKLAISAIYYLIMVRPPVRELCVDALEDLWRNYDDAKPMAAKYLAKWRPHVLQEEANGAAGVGKKEE